MHAKSLHVLNKKIRIVASESAYGVGDGSRAATRRARSASAALRRLHLPKNSGFNNNSDITALIHYRFRFNTRPPGADNSGRRDCVVAKIEVMSGLAHVLAAADHVESWMAAASSMAGLAATTRVMR